MSSRTSVELGLTNVASITTDVITDLSGARVDECYIYNY